MNAIAERIEKLERLIERPGTPGEGLAARAALKRTMARLPVVGRVIERSQMQMQFDTVQSRTRKGDSRLSLALRGLLAWWHVDGASRSPTTRRRARRSIRGLK
jgi:hypothetical protein